MTRPTTALLLCVLLLASCSDSVAASTSTVPVARRTRPVSILVEVYDPVTNWVWQDVGVRVVEADQEWSGCTWVSPHEDWYLTDASGVVLLDEYVLAAAEVGFPLAPCGCAVLGSLAHEDEAVVVLEVHAPGFVPVFVAVGLSYAEPDVFVAVPFQ